MKITQKIFPKISTRGFYDLKTGKTLKKIPYEVYPPKKFDDLSKKSEFTIMILSLIHI